MTRFGPISRLALLCILFVTAGCARRPLCYYEGELVPISVKIDWTNSNIPVTETDPTGGDLVHRVSFRFYPADGAEPFERYLEGNIFEGTINVPTGVYRVIAMNESIEDMNYWEDFIAFYDTDSFDAAYAELRPMSDADREARFPYYEPGADENITVAPLPLASWSLNYLEVRPPVREFEEPAPTRADTGIVPDTGIELDAAILLDVEMRALTHNVAITARVANMISMARLNFAARGLADRVYLASGLTMQSTSTYLNVLSSLVFDSDTDGTASRTFLSFGRTPVPGEEHYEIELDALLVNGSLYNADGGLTYDVTDQVTASDGLDITIKLPEAHSDMPIELPQTEGGITVDPWDDDEITLN